MMVAPKRKEAGDFPRGGAKKPRTSPATAIPTVAVKKKKAAGKKPGRKSATKSAAAAADANAETILVHDDKHHDKTFKLAKIYAEGKVVLGLVKSIQELDLVVSLPAKQFGFVSITEISPAISKIIQEYAAGGEDSDDDDSDEDDAEKNEEENKELPNLKRYFKLGQLVAVKVNQMAVNEKTGKKRTELTMQPGQLYASLAATEIKPGMVLQGAIKSEEDHGFLVEFGIDGLSGFLPAHADLTYRVGQLGFFELKKAEAGHVFRLAAIPSPASFDSVAKCTFAPGTVVVPFDPATDAADGRPPLPLAVGDVVKGEIESHTAHGMMVQLVAPHDAYRGLVPSLHVSDITLSNPAKRFPVGSKHKFRVLAKDGPKFTLTAKKTLVNSDAGVIDSYKRDHVGDFGHGTIVNVLDSGVVVQFYQHVRAFVPISEMSYEFLTSTGEYKKGQPVKCRILYANEDEKKMRASFLAEPKSKKGDKKAAAEPESVDPASASTSDESKGKKKRELKSEKLLKSFDYDALATKPVSAIDDLRVDMDLEGYVYNVKDKAGVFVALSPTVTGRVKIAELSAEFVKDWQKLVKVGDKVQCRVLSLDNNRIELTRKPRAKVEVSSSEDEDSDDDEDALAGMDVDSDEDEVASDDDEATAGVKSLRLKSGTDGEDSDDEDSDDEVAGKTSASGKSVLGGLKGFSWSTSLSDDEQDGDSSDDEDGAGASADAMDVDGDGKATGASSKNKAKRDKKKEKEEHEKKIAERQATLLNEPQLATDYERLLVGSPNSSFLWIKYMAFQLKLADVNKARSVAERAIQTIHYREEQEKLNVWVAWLNLENQYGDKASLDALFQRAVQYNDPQTVHQHLVDIFTRSGQHDRARDLYEDMTAKFKDVPAVWIRYAQFQFERDQADQARTLLPRALKHLPKAHHIHTITQMALLEFKVGDVERGRTILEGVLANYPKRVDLWSVYLDMEIKAREFDAARRLFDRIITLKFSAKKIKFFFKKYLEFEKKFGNEQRVAYVKQRAVQYVEMLNKQAA
ncbi:Protein RRP5 [Allomyces arbusculus]|nr:Protein RRP5 [Allomyces arbusculus]